MRPAIFNLQGSAADDGFRYRLVLDDLVRSGFLDSQTRPIFRHLASLNPRAHPLLSELSNSVGKFCRGWKVQLHGFE